MATLTRAVYPNTDAAILACDTADWATLTEQLRTINAHLKTK
ncbi:hypothetical protein SCG7086_BT_00050 [Chlamydiales bacterium SCGC AG-110-P3]|nr:hypothetical protein SCG7086_BT_00050 [Chlamydiales bacterium SCGC AG-110-P3]